MPKTLSEIKYLENVSDYCNKIFSLPFDESNDEATNLWIMHTLSIRQINSKYSEKTILNAIEGKYQDRINTQLRKLIEKLDSKEN